MTMVLVSETRSCRTGCGSRRGSTACCRPCSRSARSTTAWRGRSRPSSLRSRRRSAQCSPAPSLTEIEMFEYVPTSAAAGVPESRPVRRVERRPCRLVLDAERERVAVGVGRRGHEAVRARCIHGRRRRAGDRRRAIARAGRRSEERARAVAPFRKRAPTRRRRHRSRSAQPRSMQSTTIQDRTCA